jgi:chemotaxis protein MotB
MRPLFAVLGCLLLLTGCNNQQNQVATLQARADSLQQANQRLQNELASAREDAARAAPQQRVLSPAVYFPSGSAWLTDRGKQALDSLATVITTEYPDRDFHIRGYTDNVPIGEWLSDIYPSNWYLSAQRAAAVAHYLDTEHQIQTQTLEIGAYGPQNPTAPNETAQGRQQNRRVVLAVDDPQPDPGP